MLLRGWLINDALHGHSPGRVRYVMKAHWGSSPFFVRPFGGVSLPGYPAHVLPAVRLGRLAVSIKAQKRGFGALLLSEAVYRTVLIADQAGLIGLFVDAKDDTARHFYLRYGFLAIPEEPRTLFLPIETIRKLF